MAKIANTQRPAVTGGFLLAKPYHNSSHRYSKSRQATILALLQGKDDKNPVQTIQSVLESNSHAEIIQETFASTDGRADTNNTERPRVKFAMTQYALPISQNVV